MSKDFEDKLNDLLELPSEVSIVKEPLERKVVESNSDDLNTDYIEDTLVELQKCYNSDKIPPLNVYCDTCRWHKQTSKL